MHLTLWQIGRNYVGNRTKVHAAMCPPSCPKNDRLKSPQFSPQKSPFSPQKSQFGSPVYPIHTWFHMHDMCQVLCKGARIGRRLTDNVCCSHLPAQYDNMMIERDPFVGNRKSMFLSVPSLTP